MSQKIDIKRTEIKTATVQIKTLVIDNRKFTLATFRQIPIYPCVDKKEIKIVGDLLGKVNYDGWWIIWVYDGKLFRCKIKEIKIYDTLRFHELQVESYEYFRRIFKNICEKYNSVDYLPFLDVVKIDADSFIYTEYESILFLRRISSKIPELRELILSAFTKKRSILDYNAINFINGDFLQDEAHFLKEKLNSLINKIECVNKEINETQQLYIAT